MAQPQLLSLELKTFKNIEDIELENLPTITIFFDSKGNFFATTGIEEIEDAILSLIQDRDPNDEGTKLCDRANRSVLFSVNLLPGDRALPAGFANRVDSYLSFVAKRTLKKRIRKRITN
ncbi:hypothetical protein [Myxosarcina sp. GI1]|uniref:hypothetical protein n=1 Tax=Myxosarcina sp. GI1 TaxID=1541065 RepID=UPI0005612E60|nr:hypothetical protein [Myxosarcina sp. GI1]